MSFSFTYHRHPVAIQVNTFHRSLANQPQETGRWEEVSHSDLLKIPWVVSRFVPVDQPREASAIFDYDVAWSEVMVCKDKVILGRHWSSTCFLMLLSRLAGLFAKGHEVVPEIDDGRDGGCRCVGRYTVVLLEPNGPADSSPEGPGCWLGECPHPPNHAAQLKGQAERRDDAEMGPDLYESRSVDARLDALEISILCANGALYRGGSDAEGVGSGDGAGDVFEVAAVAIKLDHVAFGERNASADARPRRCLPVARLVDETEELVVRKRVQGIDCCHGGGLLAASVLFAQGKQV